METQQVDSRSPRELAVVVVVVAVFSFVEPLRDLSALAYSPRRLALDLLFIFFISCCVEIDSSAVAYSPRRLALDLLLIDLCFDSR